MNSKNEFFDISRLPNEEGILFWGISMNRIGNTQSPEKCFEDLKWIDTKISKTEGIGMVTWYSDYLYFHSDEPASLLRDRYKSLMMAHKNGFMNIILKDNVWIKKAFSFYTFGQVIIDNADIFQSALDAIVKLYEEDDTFKQCVEDDAKVANHGFGEKEKMFILEEITTIYLAAKGKLNFNNRFVPGTEKWVLHLYPGKPLKSEAYLFQVNPLKLSNPKNNYENACYDLAGKKLYNYLDIDIETFNFKD
jgi:hypothetical protein